MMINQINNKAINLYYKVLTFFYKLFYKALQFPTRNSINKFNNNNLVIAYNNQYVITDIKLGDDGLFHGSCNYESSIYSLQGATLDLLIQDLIEGIEELEADTSFK